MYFTYEGYRIEATITANRELEHHGYGLHDALDVLERGYPCSASRRKQNIEEKCLRKGSKEIKVVAALITHAYEDKYVETVWKIIHFGIITYQRRK